MMAVSRMNDSNLLDGAHALARARALQLIDRALDRSPFYARLYQGRATGLDAWQSLPVVDKSQLMAAFDDWACDRRIRLAAVQDWIADPARIGQDFLGRYAVWSTSGTTGVPGLFVHDSQALATYATLLQTRMSRRHAQGRGMVPGRLPRTALLIASDGHYAGIGFWARQQRLYPMLRASSLALNVTAPPEEIRAALQAWQPDHVASYPSMLAELARWQEDGRIDLKLAALWGGGEGLCASTRAWISSVFGAPVVNDYGASECLTIAFECDHGHLHLNDDWVLLEPVDRQDRPVPAGTASHSVLLTNLANHVQPVIRYRLGDSVTFLDRACACGDARPAFTVEGRCDDTLRLRDAQDREVRLLPMALTTALEEGADIHRFQVVQTEARALVLRLDLDRESDPRSVSDRATQVLAHYLRSQGLDQVRLQVEHDPLACDERSGKLRQVLCLLDRPA